MNRRPGTAAVTFDTTTDGLRGHVNPYVESHRGVPEIIPADSAGTFRDDWGRAFGEGRGDAPLHLELGTGNGHYLAGMSALHPERNWLGLELRFKRVMVTAKKIAGRDNARVVRYSWFYLTDLFLPGSLSGLHLNHPDPWPRGSQSKNRILDAPFVALAASLLRPGAEWRVKTDFAPHVDSLVKLVAGLPFSVEAVVRDSARDGVPWEDEVMTGYQEKSAEAGAPVLAALLRRL